MGIESEAGGVRAGQMVQNAAKIVEQKPKKPNHPLYTQYRIYVT